MPYTRISADCHIDLPMLPPDIFTANASAAMRDRMPYVTDGPDGPYWTCKNGGSFGLLCGVGPAGQKLVPGQNHRVDAMAATGLYEDGKKGVLRPSTPALRAKDIGRAVLERYPNIRISFGESGIGWIPYALDRMDYEWEDRFRDLGLKMKPSDYWRRQCKATFQYDRIGTKLIEDMGVETLMWGSDYPHPDGVWPESSKYIAEQFGHLPADVTHKITCENAGKFYGLI